MSKLSHCGVERIIKAWLDPRRLMLMMRTWAWSEAHLIRLHYMHGYISTGSYQCMGDKRGPSMRIPYSFLLQRYRHNVPLVSEAIANFGCALWKKVALAHCMSLFIHHFQNMFSNFSIQAWCVTE